MQQHDKMHTIGKQKDEVWERGICRARSGTTAMSAVRMIKPQMRYTGIMTRGEVKEILNRVLNWPDDDQAKIVRFVLEFEQWHEDHVIVDEAREQSISK
jgi:hypothetical protein